MVKFRVTLPAALLLLAALACRTLPAAVPAVPLADDDPRPGDHLAAWRAQTDERRALRGFARLAVDGGGGAVEFRARQILVLERPASLRVEVKGFLSQTALVLVTDGEEYQLLDARDGSFRDGVVSPALLWEIAYLALSPEEAARVLLGVPPQPSGLAPVAAFDLGDGAIRVDLADSEGRVLHRVSFDDAGRLLGVEVRHSEGDLAWRVRYGAYQIVDGTPFAHAVDLFVQAGETRAEIELSDIELNPDLPPDMFRLELPARSGAPGEGSGG